MEEKQIQDEIYTYVKINKTIYFTEKQGVGVMFWPISPDDEHTSFWLISQIKGNIWANKKYCHQ